MKKVLLFLLAAVVWLAASVVATAQDTIYRCGNEYLNDRTLAVARGCEVVGGGNVTVVPGTRVNRVEKDEPDAASVPARKVKRSSAVTGSPNVNTNTNAATQRSRDSDARSILLAELKSAEARLADQQTEFNNGEPKMLGSEIRHPQRYQDRVNELRDGISRFTADIAGLKREIARLPTTVAMPGLSTP